MANAADSAEKAQATGYFEQQRLRGFDDDKGCKSLGPGGDLLEQPVFTGCIPCFQYQPGFQRQSRVDRQPRLDTRGLGRLVDHQDTANAVLLFVNGVACQLLAAQRVQRQAWQVETKPELSLAGRRLRRRNPGLPDDRHRRQ